MIRIRVLLTGLIVIAALLAGCARTVVEEAGRTELAVSDTSVGAGEEIEIVLSVSGYGDDAAGINAMKGTLSYDRDVFETVEQEDLALPDSWENLRYNPENGQFVLSRRAGTREEGGVLRIRLRAGEDLPAGDTRISVEELTASDGKREITLEDAEITLSVAAEPLPEVPEPDAGDGGAEGDETPGGELPEEEFPGGELPDGELPDGELPEGELPEGELPEGELPGGELPDGEEDGGGPEDEEAGNGESDDEESGDVVPDGESGGGSSDGGEPGDEPSDDEVPDGGSSDDGTPGDSPDEEDGESNGDGPSGDEPAGDEPSDDETPDGGSTGGTQNSGDGEGDSQDSPGLEDNSGQADSQDPGSNAGAENGQNSEDGQVPEGSQVPGTAQTVGNSGWTVILGLCIAVVLLAAGILLLCKKKGWGGGMRILAGVLILSAGAAFTAGSADAFGGKGDLNGDGTADYLDVYLLKEHLVALRPLPESGWNMADMNSDEALTIRDLSLLIQRIENTVDYDVVITPVLDRVYYEKQEVFPLLFDAQVSYGGTVDRIVMNGVEYETFRQEGDSLYAVSLNAGDTSGVQEFHLTKVVLGDGQPGGHGQEAAVDHRVVIEVLKDVPSVENVRIEELAGTEQLEVSFLLRDEDLALVSAGVEVFEEIDGELVRIDRKEVRAGENAVFLDLTAGSAGQENYVVRVTADYDRDTDTLDDQSNACLDEVLYTEEITVSRDAIQFKDVTDVKLYYNDGSGAREIEILDLTGGLPADAANYYAVLEMERLPDFYAGIREFRQDADSGRVYAVLDQEDLVSDYEDGTVGQEYRIPIAFRDAEGIHPLIPSAAELFAQMAANPDGSYELTQDLDASGLSADTPAIAGVFTGELNGNGYQILNLSTPLFDTLSGAVIRDLVIDHAEITSARSGILANAIQNQSEIERVFIINSRISNQVDGLGAFAGRLNRSVIRESASVNVSVKGLVAVGGIVGKTEDGAVIENCYVTGQVQGTYDHPTLGARVGGIAGWHGGGVIRESFAQAQIFAPAMKGNGGLIGGPNTGNPVIEDCLSLSSGAGYRIAGFDVLENVKNVYEYSGSISATNITDANRDQIKETDAVYDRSLYVDALGWDEEIWELGLLEYGKRPGLKAAPDPDNTYAIPSYGQIRELEDYHPRREQAYSNLAKLMPFSDIRTWVEYGNRLADTDALATQAVQFILPLDANGLPVWGLHTGSADRIAAIRIVFEDERMQEYEVSYQKTLGTIVAVYQIAGTDLQYQFHHYLQPLEEELLAEAVNQVSDYDYAADIAALTPEEESRLYTDYYNETVKQGLEEFVEQLLLSQAEYPFYCDREAVQELVRERVREEKSWKELLYGYNYYDKWYHIEYRGVILSDLLFFGGSLLAPDMNAQELSERLLAAETNQRETHRTVLFYNSVLRDYTGKELMDFLGDLACQAAGYADPNDWFADQFDGILKEQPAVGGADGIRYRIWDILCGIEDGRKSMILPILTAPQEDMYLISIPSQLMIGSLNRYPDYLNKDGRERERMRKIIDVYAEKMGIFYGVSSTWMERSAEILNSFVNIQYDTRLNFPQSEAADAGDQDKDKTRDPVMKWVYEANNTISAKNGSAASADGTNVYWMLDAALGTSDYNFFTFSHETAHNQDGRYFYGGAGRREGTGGEAHADGNIAQEMRDGCVAFNISKINDTGTEMTNNFSYERIDSAQEIHSYYREMFETGYVLDYLAAEAFLRLTPQQQAAVAVQAVHTPGGTNSFSTEYRSLSVQEIEQMNLTKIEDLWENRISVRNLGAGSSEKVNTATDGSYGFESFYNMNWYQSHNDSGSPDTHSFKRLGMEMLGVGGYEGGYVIYMSALSESDLDALRKITGDPDITWKSYKMNRFETVKENLDRIPYFDAESVIEQFRAAFEQDAQNGTRSEGIAVKRTLYGLVKRATADFSDGGIYEAPETWDRISEETVPEEIVPEGDGQPPVTEEEDEKWEHREEGEKSPEMNEDNR